MSSQINKKKLRLIFMGTPEFALPPLKSLISAKEFSLVGIFTQPDRAVGRGQIISYPPIKKLALENNLPIFQPNNLKESINTIKDLNPDLIVVVAYGKIIPLEILNIPLYGCINIHASLLPKYRGASCLNAPILNGDNETGITIMKMDANLDTGPIIKQEKILLTGTETLSYLHDELSILGAKILVPTLLDYINKKIEPVVQNDLKASYVKTIKKEDGHINWNKSAEEIERLIRAYNPWPGTYSFLDEKLIKIMAVDKNPIKINNYKAGELFLHQKNLTVQTGQDSLTILKLQLAGKKIMTSQEFLHGHNLIGILK